MGYAPILRLAETVRCNQKKRKTNQTRQTQPAKTAAANAAAVFFGKRTEKIKFDENFNMTKNSTKRKAYDRLEEIIEMFDIHKDHIKSTYKEEQVRIQFINPMFDALGWDMDNTKRKVAPAYRDVIHEDRLNVLGKMKAPDYCFTIDGKKQFFLEAKKSSIDIKSDVLPSFQLRRYGWSAKLPISILTDFEELAIYDCTKMPKPKEKASKQRLKYFEYQKYLKEFDWIWEYFSREQVEKGSLAQLANIEKRGTETVDDAFLNSLDDWRMQLATNIALRNPNLDEDAINYLVQINLNRIVFLRNCEDRSVEPYGLLKDCVSKKGKEGQFFKNLYKTFQEAYRKYNSGLFDFNKDELSQSVQIDNKVVKSVIEELYYPNSPYEFSVIGAEILGTAYERFLGKVIRLTKGHRAKIEEKPEVRKAGGVFYTPQYIVDYIVENTVGKIIEKKTPEEITKIKICDPACGSGSFLLGAYQYLLDYHLNWYTKKEAENAAKRKKNKNKILSKELTHDGNLTTEVKKQILLNNIFGVDIDAQAVEVTRLSLLMKCMEGETGASVQMSLTFDMILPSLDNNVKVGNSLIDFDYYDGQLDFGDDKKIKPFNWKNAFPKIFKQGGFDAVIGNPPYVVLEGEFRDDDQLNYFRKKFNSASYKIDLYHLFFEQGIKLLNKSGKLGYITPSNYLSNNGLVNLRDLILSKSIIEEINVITGKVFIGASVDTALTFLTVDKKVKNSIYVKSNWSNFNLTEKSRTEFQQSIFNETKEKLFIATQNRAVKIKSFELNNRYSVKFGMQLRNRKIFTGDVINVSDKKQKTKYHRPCYTGKDIQKYQTGYSDLLAYFNREAKSGGCWDEDIHNANPKILVRQIGEHPICCLDDKGYCCLNTLFMVAPKDKNEKLSIFYILGILNSNFIQNYWASNFSDQRKTFPKIKGSYLGKLPIPEIDFKAKSEKELHNKIVNSVKSIIEAYKLKSAETNPNKINQMEGRIAYLEQEIDKLVYELYGLTEEEIEIIEQE